MPKLLEVLQDLWRPEGAQCAIVEMCCPSEAETRGGRVVRIVFKFIVVSLGHTSLTLSKLVLQVLKAISPRPFCAPLIGTFGNLRQASSLPALVFPHPHPIRPTNHLLNTTLRLAPPSVAAGTVLEEIRKSDQFAEQRWGNIYYPFASKEDWEVAAWLIESGLSMGEIDKFLKLAFVSRIFMAQRYTNSTFRRFLHRENFHIPRRKRFTRR